MTDNELIAAGSTDQRPHATRSILVSACVLALITTPCCVPVHIPGGGGEPPGGDPTDPPFSVALEVSNPTPQANEEVHLRCVASGTFEPPLQYEFESTNDRLQVNRSTGTAGFIVDATDVGQSIGVSCSATDALGRTADSSGSRVTPF